MDSRTISTPTIPQPRRFYTTGIRLLVAAAVLALLVISAMALGQGFSAGQTAAPVSAPLSDDRFLAQNPELSITARYAAVQDETSFLARNPELAIAARYALANILIEDGASILHRNPELSAARRYSIQNAGD